MDDVFLYDGNNVTFSLRCNNSVMKTIIDHFGEDVIVPVYDMVSYRLRAEVSAIRNLFGWVFWFGGKVQILATEEVKVQYKKIIKQASENMNYF